jgi:hypothetical protein
MNSSSTSGNGNANLGMLQHQLNDEALLNLMEHEEGKQLKMVGLHNGMMPTSTTPAMWPQFGSELNPW